MSKGRLEAFSDGVIAIIITIMVLELKVPHEAELSALLPGLPIFAHTHHGIDDLLYFGHFVIGK